MKTQGSLQLAQQIAENRVDETAPGAGGKRAPGAKRCRWQQAFRGESSRQPEIATAYATSPETRGFSQPGSVPALEQRLRRGGGSNSGSSPGLRRPLG